ncbi:unnamed protein product [Nippostrongylus brasiliensis]|uniref:Uncharacterized protein n=1 Tax=Nippostrongylus brasiliensis TaxID=27835 RepID=A0A0N4XWJ2_NIPBR|nr:unnamed protein product [Nippostrongylus brasiliensis]
MGCIDGLKAYPYSAALRLNEQHPGQKRRGHEIIACDNWAVFVPATGDDGKSSIQELMNRYLNKSRESLPRGISPPPPPPRPSEPEPGEIRRLVDRYCSPTATETRENDSRPPHSHAVEGSHTTKKVEEPSARVVKGGGEVRTRGDAAYQPAGAPPPKKTSTGAMWLGLGGGIDAKENTVA